jgi:glycerol-3-phosphate dehydrogenase
MAAVWRAVEPNIAFHHLCTQHTLTRTRVLPTVLVRDAVHNEYAQTVVDFAARHARLTSLSVQIALDVLPAQRAPVVEIMVQELRWSASRRQETREVEAFTWRAWASRA